MSKSDSMEEILVSHYKKYPRMQIQDMVKLIYQSEFAGGHMVADRNKSLERLREELISILNTSGSGAVDLSTCDDVEHMGCKTGPAAGVELFEDIGNGLCRVNLRGLRNCSISLETINSFFVYTANTSKGSMDGFEVKLTALRDMCERGILPYTAGELDDYLVTYRINGCPPVSHSECYRQAYSPAYRVVDRMFKYYFEVFCRIDALVNRLKKQPSGIGSEPGRSVNVAIEGNSGAGKSSLAALLEEIYDCNVFHMDHYFLTPELRTEERLKEAGGNVDYVRFRKEVINGLKSGKEFNYQIYDCSKGALDQIVKVKPKMLNIIEGSYSLHPTLTESYDLKIFLGIGAEEQSRRILERNGPFMHEKFISLWIPLENRYFSELDIVSQCDIVINV